ncbi:MAG: MBL fold metallo-hydrolase [Acidobacteriota bacterium]|nr:MBL fold metallo-hydrolase [Acidobacteriota bacterium]
MSLAAGAAALAPRWMMAQAAQAADPVAQMRAAGASTPIKTTKLYDNLYLLQGAGGNMAAQTGPDGKLLIDSSFATAVPKIREALAALSSDPASTLINTHWHIDHTDGNEGMHTAGFTIYAHEKTRERLATPQTMKMMGFSLPAAPAGALPVLTFDQSMRLWHNGDSLALEHFSPAHTDTDIYIHFHKADVLHVGDIWFNGMYPFIDEGTGGTIGGMIKAGEKALAIAGPETKIIPGHGPLGTKAQLQQFHDMLSAVHEKVAALKASGASEQEVIAKKPSAAFDAAWGKGMMNGDAFTGIVYRTI